MADTWVCRRCGGEKTIVVDMVRVSCPLCRGTGKVDLGMAIAQEARLPIGDKHVDFYLTREATQEAERQQGQAGCALNVVLTVVFILWIIYCT